MSILTPILITLATILVGCETLNVKTTPDSVEFETTECTARVEKIIAVTGHSRYEISPVWCIRKLLPEYETLGELFEYGFQEGDKFIVITSDDRVAEIKFMKEHMKGK